MSANNGLLIECGPTDNSGKRTITAILGTHRHRDKFDIDDSFKRAKFRDKVIGAFDLDEGAHEYIEGKILSAAESSESIIQCSTVRMSDVAPEQVEWLWRERMAIGKLTLLVGDPGQGKSFLTLDIAARVSRGAAWPDNPWEPQQVGDVILLTAEDDLGDTIRPRLDALEADVSRIIAIKGAKFDDDDRDRMVNLSTDLDSIRKVARDADQPRVLVIDPVSAYLGKTDSHNNAEVRGVLAPLAELASELRLAVIAVSHLRKGEGAAMYRTMGSLAFIAAARSAWVVAKDEADPTRRLMLPLKSNIAPDVGGLAFAILPHGPNDAPVLCWEREPVTTAADDAIGHNQQRKRGPAPDERTEAAEWLRAELSSGPRPAKELIEDGDEHGYTKRTLQRAYREVVKGKPSRDGFGGPVIWSLPIDATIGVNGVPLPKRGTNGQTCHQWENP